MRRFSLVSMFALTACGLVPFGSQEAEQASVPDTAPVAEPVVEATEAGASALPDPTLPPPPGVGSSLGRTVVSLGDPAEGGMWLKTPLVTSEQPGQIRYRGATVAVTLRPLNAEVGAGSQISVRAMQALGASLSELVEVDVETT